jgi:glycosyltransferase involved in cell wall biosynthesis
MHIIQLHNHKRQGGGDGSAFARTCAILGRRGQPFSACTGSTPSGRMRAWDKLRLFGQSLFSRRGIQELASLPEGDGPFVLHVHNLYPLFSPAVLAWARRRGVPVVYHCHNYRLTCPVETHFHAGRTCRKCLEGGPGWCLARNCRGNLAESAAYALQNLQARRSGLADGLVAAFIAPTRFTRDWLAAAGVPAAKLAVLPYPVPAPGTAADPARGEYVAFAGRNAPEKGLDTLLAAAKRIGLPLQVAGAAAPGGAAARGVVWRGFLRGAELESFYRGARFLVVPSLWFETFGLVAAEAMAHGIPVVASRIGALAELVEDGRTGSLFSPGDADELAEAMLRLWREPERCRRLGAAGREKVLRLCDPDAYYAGLMDLYAKVTGG